MNWIGDRLAIELGFIIMVMKGVKLGTGLERIRGGGRVKEAYG